MQPADAIRFDTYRAVLHRTVGVAATKAPDTPGGSQ
jgi:hypothetical protein